MSNTTLEATRKPTWLTKIADSHTSAYGYGYNNDVMTASRERIEKFEYRKIALLNYRNDLMNKLSECADKISEIDHEIRTISGTRGKNEN